MAEGRGHPDCRNSYNPYHKCVDFCFLKIAESKERMEQLESDVKQAGRTTDCPARSDYPNQAEDHHVQESGRDEHDNVDDDDDYPIEENVEVENTQLTEWKKKLLELNLKLDESRNAYDTAIVAELKRSEASKESRSICNEKWIDEKIKTMRELVPESRKAYDTAITAELKRSEASKESRSICNEKWIDEKIKTMREHANGLHMKKADMLDTQEAAEKYKKCEKKPASFGLDVEPVSNQKTLYDADKKLTKNIECNAGEYNKMKEADPEFYSDASSSLQYGKAPKISEDKICKMVKQLHDKDEKEDMIYKMVKELLDKDEKEDMIYKMVQELLDKDEKRKAFSKTRKFHEEKDIDSINDNNESFNKIIERAYRKYTQEIKTTLEGGTGLQGCVGAGLFTFCIGVAVLNCIRVSIQ